MYNTLKKMKDKFPYEQFKMMVEQAYKKKKITKEEHDELLKQDEEE